MDALITPCKVDLLVVEMQQPAEPPGEVEHAARILYAPDAGFFERV
jgi:hypothetical protein